MNQTLTLNPPVPVFLMFSQMTLRLFQGLIDRCLAARLRGWERPTALFAGISTPRPCHITTTLLSELFRSYTSSAPSQVMFIKRTGSECNQSIAKKKLLISISAVCQKFHKCHITRCRDVFPGSNRFILSTLFTGKMSKISFWDIESWIVFRFSGLCAIGSETTMINDECWRGFRWSCMGCNDVTIAFSVTWLVLGPFFILFYPPPGHHIFGECFTTVSLKTVGSTHPTFLILSPKIRVMRQDHPWKQEIHSEKHPATKSAHFCHWIVSEDQTRPTRLPCDKSIL